LQEMVDPLGALTSGISPSLTASSMQSGPPGRNR
jgi:hypothetical protein